MHLTLHNQDSIRICSGENLKDVFVNISKNEFSYNNLVIDLFNKTLHKFIIVEFLAIPTNDSYKYYRIFIFNNEEEFDESFEKLTKGGKIIFKNF